MEAVALALAALAGLLALAAYFKAAGLRGKLDDGVSEARRLASNAAEEAARAGEVQRQLLARVAAGEPVTRDMVLEGRLWPDVGDAEGQRMLAEDQPFVVDVRTTEETRAGMLPGAVHIPVDQIEERKSEIPRRGRKVLLYCAGGARSAAACEFLCSEGFEGVHNLEGGIESWSGPTEPPRA